MLSTTRKAARFAVPRSEPLTKPKRLESEPPTTAKPNVATRTTSEATDQRSGGESPPVAFGFGEVPMANYCDQDGRLFKLDGLDLSPPLVESDTRHSKRLGRVCHAPAIRAYMRRLDPLEAEFALKRQVICLDPYQHSSSHSSSQYSSYPSSSQHSSHSSSHWFKSSSPGSSSASEG